MHASPAVGLRKPARELCVIQAIWLGGVACSDVFCRPQDKGQIKLLVVTSSIAY
jgi:hypothetical protein